MIRGFTLIELLVVIAIIGILSGLVLASISTARRKSRDAQRITEIRQMATALEAYYDDHNGYPPDNVGNWEKICQGTAVDFSALVTLGYMGAMPCDPLNTGSNSTGFAYYFDPDNGGSGGLCTGTACPGYCLYTRLERTGALYGVAGGGQQGCPGV